MNEKFKVGDVVKLKSGGPDMTIEFIGEKNGQMKVTCIWFENNEKKYSDFKSETLEKIEPPQKYDYPHKGSPWTT